MKNLDLAAAESIEDEGKKEVAVVRVTQRLERVLEDLRGRVETQCEAVVQNSRTVDESFYDTTKPFDEGDVDDFKKKFMDRYDNKEVFVIKEVLAKAAAAMTGAEGLKKLEECLGGLEHAQVFDGNVKPVADVNDAKLLAMLGIQVGSKMSSTQKELILAAWRAHASTWTKPTTEMTPRETFLSWKEASESTDSDARAALGRHAMRACSRPISAAACERIYSFLEHMDSSDRANMKKAMLKDLLFLRGNHHVIAELIAEESAAIIAAKRDAVLGAQQKRERDVATAAAALAAKRARKDKAAQEAAVRALDSAPDSDSS